MFHLPFPASIKKERERKEIQKKERKIMLRRIPWKSSIKRGSTAWKSPSVINISVDKDPFRNKKSSLFPTPLVFKFPPFLLVANSMERPSSLLRPMTLGYHLPNTFDFRIFKIFILLDISSGVGESSRLYNEVGAPSKYIFM